MNKVVCPQCDGTAEYMVARLYPTGHTECWEECPYCEGAGEFDESDFIMLKLEGHFIRDLYT